MNALMSFSYGLLVAELVGSINAVGLDHNSDFSTDPDQAARPSP